jgi:hypothetical protein
MGQGTITLPSGDKLVTQQVTFGGATVHREEMVIAGTINQQIAAVTNSTPGSSDYGLPVRPIQVINDIVHAMNAALNNIAAVGGQLDDTGTTDATENNVAVARITTKRAWHVNLRNDGGTEIGTSGNPVRTDPTGSTTQPVSFPSQQPIHGTVVISSMPAVNVSAGSVAYITNPAVSVVGTVTVASLPAITFSGAQPISTLAGTVSVTFPSAQSVNVTNTPTVTFSGQQPVHGTVQIGGIPSVSINNTPLPISTIAGTVAVSFTPAASQNVILTTPVAAGTILARYDEQQTQSSRLLTIDSDIQAVTAAVLGTPAVKFASAQSVNVANTPAITFSGQQPVHGTVVVSEMPAIQVSAGSVAYITNPAVSVVGTVNVSNTVPITFSGAQPISTVAGTVSVTFSSTQSVNIANTPSVTFAGQQPIHGTVQVGNTVGVNVTNTPAITFSGQQPVHGTVQIGGIPSVIFSGVPTVTANQGTPAGINNAWPIKAYDAISGIGVNPGNSSYDAINVSLVNNDTSHAKQDSNTYAPTTFAAYPIGGFRYDTTASELEETHFGAPRLTFQRAFHTNLRRTDGREVGTSGTPLHIIATTANPVNIGAIAGTVQVAFTPASVQSVSMTTAAAGGTVLARYDEQQTQTTALQLIDDTVHAANAAFSKSLAVGGQLDDLSTTVASENNVSPIRITRLRAQHISLRNEDGQEIGTSGTPLRIDPTGTTTQPVSISGAIPISTVAGTVITSFPSAQAVTISAPVNIGAVAGTVNVAFTPAAVQSVNLRNVGGVEIGTSGTPVFTSATVTSLPNIVFSGQQPVHGTVQINGPLGGGVEATALRVTLANDSTGVVSVDDNGSSLTIDGSVNVGNLPTVGTVVFQSAQAITFSGAQPISTVAGTITANIRNSIFTHKTARVDAHGPGNHTIVAGEANKRIKVYASNLQASFGGTVFTTWMDGTLPMAGTQIYIDREGHVESVSPPAFLFAPQPGTALVLHVGTIVNSGGAFRGRVSYWNDDNF